MAHPISDPVGALFCNLDTQDPALGGFMQVHTHDIRRALDQALRSGEAKSQIE